MKSLLLCLLFCWNIASSSQLSVPGGPLKGSKCLSYGEATVQRILLAGKCSEHAAEIGKAPAAGQSSGKTSDVHWRPKCLPDGTYAPIQFNLKTGLKFCVSKEGIILVGPQRSLSDCECPRKRFEKFQTGNFTGYIHRCDTDFTYAVQQWDSEKNVTYCLMKDGELIQEYSGAHIKACKCPRQWYEAKISTLPNRYGPQCHPDGAFKLKQCHDGLCWCANSEGEQVSESRIPETSPEAANLCA